MTDGQCLPVVYCMSVSFMTWDPLLVMISLGVLNLQECCLIIYSWRCWFCCHASCVEQPNVSAEGVNYDDDGCEWSDSYFRQVVRHCVKSRTSYKSIGHESLDVSSEWYDFNRSRVFWTIPVMFMICLDKVMLMSRSARQISYQSTEDISGFGYVVYPFDVFNKK